MVTHSDVCIQATAKDIHVRLEGCALAVKHAESCLWSHILMCVSRLQPKTSMSGLKAARLPSSMRSREATAKDIHVRLEGCALAVKHAESCLWSHILMCVSRLQPKTSMSGLKAARLPSSMRSRAFGHTF